MNKKYKLTKENIQLYGRTLYRIKALKDFSNVKKGDLGGFVESKDNLSQKDDCWVYDNASVSDNAKVTGNAVVNGNAQISGNAKVSGDAFVSSNAQVHGNAEVSGDVFVLDNAGIYGNAFVFEKAQVTDNAIVAGDARVSGAVVVHGYAEIGGNAIIKSLKDYVVFNNAWSSGRYFTYTKSNKMWRVGCFYGTGLELIAKAYKDSKESGDKYKATVQYAELVTE